MLPIALNLRENAPAKTKKINVTSRGEESFKRLSPFFTNVSYNGIDNVLVENFWQFSKVYPHLGHWDEEKQRPTKLWEQWSQQGMASRTAHRYPVGHPKKKNSEYQQPIGSWWNNELLSYVEARKKIYVPYYMQSIENSEEYSNLRELAIGSFHTEYAIAIIDFDVYRHYKEQDINEARTSLLAALNNPAKKFGHGFVILGMLYRDLKKHYNI